MGFLSGDFSCVVAGCLRISFRATSCSGLSFRGFDSRNSWSCSGSRRTDSLFRET